MKTLNKFKATASNFLKYTYRAPSFKYAVADTTVKKLLENESLTLEEAIKSLESGEIVTKVYSRYFNKYFTHEEYNEFIAQKAIEQEIDFTNFIKYEDLTIDIGAYEVIYKGNIVRLAPKELELFHFMASNPNKVFTREQLMFEVWGYDYPGDSRTVDVHVKRLREKIKGGKEWELQTVWGVGYKFEVR